jgi:nicotinamidase-related amidase
VAPGRFDHDDVSHSPDPEKDTLMRQALLVIDVQESFRHRPYWIADEVRPFLANVQGLIDACRAKRIPILQIFHQDLGEDASNPFTAASGHVKVMTELNVPADEVFYKHVHSALFGTAADGTTVEGWLRARGIEEVLITGIRTEQCCETTARHSFDSGFAVRYVTDATLTFPMTSKSGRTFSSAELRERTELVLDGRFARIVATSNALAVNSV